MDTLTKCFEALADSNIERDKGIINNVCVVRVGEAKGHDTWIDGMTLETVAKVGNANPEGVKVKLRHSASIPGFFQSVLEESFGLLKDFKVVDTKVIARLEMLRSLEPKLIERAFEMAEKMSSQFGLSIDFAGSAETIGGKKFLRCSGLKSVDLTDKPAATDGLFSMKEPQNESGTTGKHKSDCMCADCDKAKMEAGSGKSGTHPLDEKMQALEATVNKLVDAFNKLAAAPAPADGQFEAITARLEKAEKFVETSAKLVETTERNNLISQLDREGRVVFKSKDVAYKLEELQALPIETLKFAAVNAPVLPLQARLSYSGTGKPPKGMPVGPNGKPLKGDALTEAAWEEQYGDFNTMLARSMGKTN